MCEYCEKGKPIKKTDGGSYYKIIESEIEHHDECLDSYYSYTEKIPINYNYDGRFSPLRFIDKIVELDENKLKEEI